MSLVISNPVKHKEFSVIGSFAETTNAAEMKGEGVIGQLWERFYHDEIRHTIPNKMNTSILALYTNYESDETGKYSFGIGAEVEQNTTVPEGLEKVVVPEANYIIFTTRKGPVHEVVVEAWKEIWEWSKTNERAFLTDFELYDERATDPENSQIDIYISVKG